MLKLGIALLLALFLPFSGSAKEATPLGEDPVVEQHMMRLAEKLRCLVCQNQTIADSNAPLAMDLRSQIREKLQQGMSDEQIVEFMVARYGDFVLYRPPVKSTTLLLWFGPALLLVIGAAVLYVNLSRRRRLVSEAELSAEEEQRARALLQGDAEKGSS